MKVKALKKEEGSVIYVHFPQGQMPLRGEAFKRFLEANGFQELLVVFTNSAPEGAELVELEIPISHKGGWRKLREALRKQIS